MAKRFARYDVDDNHREIRSVFDQGGGSVFDAARVGGGFPDLVPGVVGLNLLVEVKNPGPVGWKYTEAQKKFRSTWNGKLYVVETQSQAIALVNAVRRQSELIKHLNDVIDKDFREA